MSTNLSPELRVSASNQAITEGETMNQPDTETIDAFAKRSDRAVIGITVLFAFCGALFDLGAHTISAVFMNGAGVSMLWGMWIPLCFITIPPIHYLCRRVQTLEKRIDELERQSVEQRAA